MVGLQEFYEFSETKNKIMCLCLFLKKGPLVFIIFWKASLIPQMLSITGLNYISSGLNWDELLLLLPNSGQHSMRWQCCSPLKCLWPWKASTVPWTPRVPASQKDVHRIMGWAVFWSNYSSQCVRSYFYDRKKNVILKIFSQDSISKEYGNGR